MLPRSPERRDRPPAREPWPGQLPLARQGQSCLCRLSHGTSVLSQHEEYMVTLTASSATQGPAAARSPAWHPLSGLPLSIGERGCQGLPPGAPRGIRRAGTALHRAVLPDSEPGASCPRATRAPPCLFSRRPQPTAHERRLGPGWGR